MTQTPDSAMGDLPELFEAWWETSPRKNREEIGYRLKKILAFEAFCAGLALTTDREAAVRRETVEAAWRDGWAECKARLTDDEAFCLTEDVEEDAWLESKARNDAAPSLPIASVKEG